jgi:hypothetical protein
MFVSAKLLDDCVTQLLESSRITSKAIEQPSKQRSSGVSTSEEDVKELGAKFDGVLGLGGQCFKEDVFIFGTCYSLLWKI